MGSNTSAVASNFDSIADAKLRSDITAKEIYSIGNYHSPKVYYTHISPFVSIFLLSKKLMCLIQFLV